MIDFDFYIKRRGLDTVVVSATDYKTLLSLLEDIYDLGIEEGRDREYFYNLGGERY